MSEKKITLDYSEYNNLMQRIKELEQFEKEMTEPDNERVVLVNHRHLSGFGFYQKYYEVKDSMDDVLKNAIADLDEANGRLTAIGDEFKKIPKIYLRFIFKQRFINIWNILNGCYFSSWFDHEKHP